MSLKTFRRATLAAALILMLVIGVSHFLGAFAPETPAAMPFQPVDFTQLRRPAAPDNYLLAPADIIHVPLDAEAPVFSLNIEDLQTDWNLMMAKQQGVIKTAENPDGLQLDYKLQVRDMKIPDFITVRFIPLRSDPATVSYSTIAIYSRSGAGPAGTGVNKKRVTDWLAQMPVQPMEQ